MIKGTYTYQCDLCENMRIEEWRSALGMEPLNPSPPEGWTRIEWALICNLHDRSETTLADALGYKKKTVGTAPYCADHKLDETRI